MFRTALTAALAGALVLSPLAAAPAFARAEATATSAEIILKKTVADLQAGKPDYGTMVPELAEAIKGQPALIQQLKALGPARSFTRLGDKENPWQFDATFESGMVLTWTISIDDSGKISGLFVKAKDA
ncbi:MAG: hypothetical protein KA105_09585 [Caulobacter sp.]|jgi:hypothetical protein|nr:hypothetical protein [Caulobacter sp.]